MTLANNTTARLWETFRAGGGAGLLRGAVELVLQELIKAEAAEAIGAGRYEHSDARVTERSGHRPRLLATQAGDVNLKIPKLRNGNFFPSLLEPRRRIDRALRAVVTEAYVAGVSNPPPIRGGLGSVGWICSYSMVGIMPRVLWRRWWLYQPVIHRVIFCRAWSRVVHWRRLMSSWVRAEKNELAEALSRALPVRPVD